MQRPPNSPADTHADEISQQDLRVLLDHAPDAISRFNRALRHVYVNEATARENNRPASDFYHMSMEDLGHAPEVCEFINSNLRHVFHGGKERTSELLFEGPLGPKWFQCRMAPEFGADGSVESVLVISRDISELKAAEKRVRESDSKATQVALSRQMAHEINNPLTAVVYAVHLLKTGEGSPDDRQRLLDIATENLERVTAISKQLLSVYGSE
jgi:nitrogen-specific signal transduction histidine kinase